jgi:hypothetical protein
MLKHAALKLIVGGFSFAAAVNVASASPSCSKALEAKQATVTSDFAAFKARQKDFAYKATYPKLEDSNVFIANELPDTLYQWLTVEAATTVIQNNRLASLAMLGSISDIPRFFWKTPVGSFGYGAVSMRIKLKADVTFERTEWNDRKCSSLRTRFNVSKTVFVSFLPGNGYHEFFLCDNGPIHSISIGTQEHLREIKGEAQWMHEHEPEDYDLIVKNLGNRYNERANKMLPVVDMRRGFMFDQFQWSFRELDSRIEAIESLRTQLSIPNGIIFFNEGITTNRADHFSSTNLHYWDP